MMSSEENTPPEQQEIIIDDRPRPIWRKSSCAEHIPLVFDKIWNVSYRISKLAFRMLVGLMISMVAWIVLLVPALLVYSSYVMPPSDYFMIDVVARFGIRTLGFFLSGIVYGEGINRLFRHVFLVFIVGCVGFVRCRLGWHNQMRQQRERSYQR